MRHRWQMARWTAAALGVAAASALGTLAAARVSVNITAIERPRLPPAPREASLGDQLAAVDAAIAAGDRSRAVYAWRDAYGLALRARDWRSLVLAGDAAARIDRLSQEQPALRSEARQAYLLALFRARAAGAADGVRHVADAFAGLGDGEMAARARAIRVRESPP